jgi:hypothetical protein
VSVHSSLPEGLARAVGEVLRAAGVEHVVHGTEAPVEAGAAAAHDGRAVAFVGPYRSADVAEAVEATAPAGLALLAPVATWAGVTRDDEPGCDDAARHRGTVLRLVARDTVVAERIAADVRASGRTALVVAGAHEYGVQLDGQLRMAGLPRTEEVLDADLVVLAGLAGAPEIDWVAGLAPLPVVAFDGVQGAPLGDERDVQVAMPFAEGEDFAGVAAARRAAGLVVAALGDGASDRASMLAALRELGPFDEHGDPVDPPVWLWRADADWALTAERPL